MKKLILIILLAFPLISIAQKVDTAIFNGAAKIVVSNNKSATENYKLAAEKLLDHGYIIDKSDKEFFQLFSGGVKVYGEGVSRILSLYVLSRDGSIIIVGRTKKTDQMQIVNTPKDTDNYESMVYKKSLLLKDIFGKMEKYAKTLGGTLTFSE